MTTIEGARLIAGSRLNELGPRDDAKQARTAVVRGKALIFWDPKVPGKKLDAIDTDQITPADDCVSERLDTLTEGGGHPTVRRDHQDRTAGVRRLGSSHAGDALARREGGAAAHLDRADPLGAPRRQGRGHPPGLHGPRLCRSAPRVRRDG